MHRRFTPREHGFVYRIFLFALDLDELDTLDARLRLFSTRRANLYRFHDADFFPVQEPLHNATSAPIQNPPSTIRDPQSLKSRVVAHLATRGIDLAGGRVVLVALPRVLGYLFNPVAFYFCYDRTGAPVAALSEVTNTFREMKTFTLAPDTRDSDGFHLRAPKHFYVSPFSDVDVEFDFLLRPPGERLSVHIDDYTAGRRTLTSTLTGARRPLTDGQLLRTTLRHPLVTLRIITLIHWHALRLWLKRVPWFAKAARAADQRDLHRPHASLVRPASS